MPEIKLKISEYKNIIETLREASGIDFSEYSLSSFKRRLEQKAANDKLSDVSDLITLLTKDGKYLEKFLFEISVPVTDFFRDADTWISIRNTVFPKLRKKEQIRILVPECTSGEEIYSLAVLLKESELLQTASIEACDISKLNIEKIKKGIYPIKELEPAGRNYNELSLRTPFSEYFYEKNSDLAINTEILKNVEFKIQDLNQGTFNGFYDLILFRNRLIYYNPQMQAKLLRKIYDMVHKSGFMVLGVGENLALHSDLKFTIFDKTEKIFKKARF